MEEILLFIFCILFTNVVIIITFENLYIENGVIIININTKGFNEDKEFIFINKLRI